MSLVAVRVRELAEGGEDGGRVLLGDARGLRRVSGGVRARNGRRDRSPILRCGSAHTLLLSPFRRRRVPNLLIMFLIYCSRRKFTILIFQNAMPARIVTSAFPLCDVRLGGIDAMWSLASKFRSRGG